MLGRFVVVLTVLCAMARAADSGGFGSTMFGARRNGMAASVARADDLTALFHNPAALADQRGLRFHLSGVVYAGETDFGLQALDPGRFPTINPTGCGEGSDPGCPWPIHSDGTYRDRIETGLVLGASPFAGVSSDLHAVSPWLGDLVVSAAVYLTSSERRSTRRRLPPTSRSTAASS